MEDRIEKLIDQKQLAILLGVNSQTITRWKKLGKIPKPLVDDDNRPFWSKIQIVFWLEGRKNGE